MYRAMSGPDDDLRDAANGPAGKEKNMTDDSIRGGRGQGAKPVHLDGRRSVMDRVEVEIRRDLLADIRSGQAAERRRQEAFEEALFSRPAETWTEAAAKAEYLLQLFAATAHARPPDRQRLVTSVLDDLARLAREQRARDGVGEDEARDADETDNEDDSG